MEHKIYLTSRAFNLLVCTWFFHEVSYGWNSLLGSFSVAAAKADGWLLTCRKACLMWPLLCRRTGNTWKRLIEFEVDKLYLPLVVTLTLRVNFFIFYFFLRKCVFSEDRTNKQKTLDMHISKYFLAGRIFKMLFYFTQREVVYN